MADGEGLEVRVARLEERTGSLEHWRDVLAKDIEETNQILAAMDSKLDRALLSAQRALPTWAHYLLWGAFTGLGILGALLASHTRL